jgi:selenide,water dikinase
VQHPDLLVGFNTGDDAAVYRLTDDLCIIQTIDFFPPIVDDAYDFGAIAAVNALSDVYAMGGTPLLALNVVCFPEDQPMSILSRILQGGSDVAKEANVLIAGGHTVKDAEPKYGMAVTGTIHPDKIVTNAAAKSGDLLVLTKSIGTGIISTAAKNGVTDEATIAGAVTAMRQLNKEASEAMVAAGVVSATDVTGFGLAGHLLGMMRASGTTGHVRLSDVPLLPGTRELAERGVVPGGTRKNYDAVDRHVRWAAEITDEEKLILCDAQTSGGLLLCIPEAMSGTLLKELSDRGVKGTVIGNVTEDTGKPLEVTS